LRRIGFGDSHNAKRIARVIRKEKIAMWQAKTGKLWKETEQVDSAGVNRRPTTR
jgi:hypothetical protein